MANFAPVARTRVKPTSEIISISKFAEIVGCTEGTVRNAVRAGKIVDSVVRDIETGKLKGIYWERGRTEWASNFETGGAADTVARGLAKVDDGIRDFNESRAAKEHYQAELARLEFEEKERQLLKRSDVERQLYAYAKEVAVELRAVGRLCAPEVAGLGDIVEVERMVNRFVDDALNKLTEVVARDFN